jgi:hypothetical protein
MEIGARRALWARLGTDLRPAHLDLLVREIDLDELDDVLSETLQGGALGRTIVRIRAKA